jgi:hypothetical protein
MTEGEQGKVQDPLAAAIPDDVAADLPTLMMRLERSRRFFYAEREYIKLILMGAAFVLAGLLASPDMPRRTFVVLTFFATPWLFGWYHLPARRLANVFRNETMPFLLRHFGRWNYALEGQHFAKKALKETGLIDPTDLIGVSDIITGERYGVPMQLALTTAWTPHRFGIYRPAKPNFRRLVGEYAPYQYAGHAVGYFAARAASAWGCASVMGGGQPDCAGLSAVVCA